MYLDAPTWTLKPTKLNDVSMYPTFPHDTDPESFVPTVLPSWTLKPTTQNHNTKYPTLFHDFPAEGVTRIPTMSNPTSKKILFFYPEAKYCFFENILH